ncbi:hypothetical protein ASD15_14765 [Massilia sp. Root351]|nr:hypothetical protein ASD15_14765 [Massilia sp. Root351]
MLAIGAAGAIHADAAACSTRDVCISAVMDAARSGNLVSTLQLTTELRKTALLPATKPGSASAPLGPSDPPHGNADDTLIATLEAASAKDEFSPDVRRTLAQAYLSAGRPHDAERYLRESVALIPIHAQLWGDLATALTMQGKTSDAVSALVVAYAFAADQGQARKLYEQAAAMSPLQAMRPVYAETLAALASMPPLPETGTGKKNKPDKMIAIQNPEECAKPDWPRHSLRREETGTVTIAFYVDENGKLAGIRNAGSSGHIALDLAAMAGLASCKFSAAVIDGKPAALWMKMQYVWTLQE